MPECSYGFRDTLGCLNDLIDITPAVVSKIIMAAIDNEAQPEKFTLNGITYDSWFLKSQRLGHTEHFVSLLSNASLVVYNRSGKDDPIHIEDRIDLTKPFNRLKSIDQRAFDKDKLCPCFDGKITSLFECLIKKAAEVGVASGDIETWQGMLATARSKAR